MGRKTAGASKIGAGWLWGWLSLVLLYAGVGASDEAPLRYQPFVARALDESTGEGVPGVELITVNKIRRHTDRQGYAEFLANDGGGGGIRTHETSPPSGFQDRRLQPLGHPTELSDECVESAPPASSAVSRSELTALLGRLTISGPKLTHEVFP